MSASDVIALDVAHVAEYGYAIRGVVPPGDDHDGLGSWVYTVGLLDAMGHPEMIIAGAPPSIGASILSTLVPGVFEGERFEINDTIDLGSYIARVGEVNKLQYRLETFNTWHGLKRAGVFRAPELLAVQIMLPPELCASGKAASQPQLARRGARVYIG